MSILHDLIASKLNGGGGGGGGDVTPSSIVTATGQMNSSQAKQTLENIGGTKVFVVTFTYSNSQWRTDKTLQEVYAAFTAKYLVLFVYSTAIAIARVENDGVTTVYRGETVYNPNGRLAYNIDMQMISGVGNSVNVKLLDGTIQQTVSGTTPTITPAANTVYNCGELTALTISALPASGEMFTVLFVSGSTPTVVSFPQSVILPDGFEFDTDTIYEMSFRRKTVRGVDLWLGAVQGWPIPAEEV